MRGKELLSTKSSSGQVTAALPLLLVRLVLDWFKVVPATVIPITHNLNPGLQHFKGIAITISTPGPLPQTKPAHSPCLLSTFLY